MTDRATLTAKQKDALPTSAFAYTDSEGNNHLPIHDQVHVQAALGRFGQTEFDAESDKPAAAKKIVKAAKGFGMTIDPESDVGKAAGLKPKTESNSARADNPVKTCPTCKGAKKIMEGNRKCPTCHATGVVPDTSSNSVTQAEWHERVQQGLLEGASLVWERADMTFDDVRRAVQGAICEELTGAWVFNPDTDYLYVQDLTADWAVFSVNYDGPLYQVDYSCSDDGACTVDMDSRKEVARVTSYAPVPAGSSNGGEAVDDAIARDEKLPATGRSDESEPEGTEHREKVPVQVKRSNWTPSHEWAWPAQATFRVQERKDGKEPALTADFTGYAAITGGDGYAVSDWLGTYTERMAPGCFAKTLREASAVPLLFNHTGMPIASYPGTSDLCEDSTGLRNDAVLDLRSSLSNDIAISMSRGDLSKMSFSFAAIKQSWSKDYEERDVTESRLYDTSIVTFPMNPATSAMLRSAMQEGLGREGFGDPPLAPSRSGVPRRGRPRVRAGVQGAPGSRRAGRQAVRPVRAGTHVHRGRRARAGKSRGSDLCSERRLVEAGSRGFARRRHRPAGRGQGDRRGPAGDQLALRSGEPRQRRPRREVIRSGWGQQVGRRRRPGRWQRVWTWREPDHPERRSRVP